jgi:hypothetical protein
LKLLSAGVHFQTNHQEVPIWMIHFTPIKADKRIMKTQKNKILLENLTLYLIKNNQTVLNLT